MIDEKIAEIAKRRGFTSFWEVYDFMVLANYSELDAMMIGLELFDGQIWNKVINASWRKPNTNNITWSSSTATITINSSGGTGDYVMVVDPATGEPDDLMVEIYIMTKEAKSVYIEMYKSYIETRKYTEVPELEGHIKTITLKLTTELSINLFKNGCKNIK